MNRSNLFIMQTLHFTTLDNIFKVEIMNNKSDDETYRILIAELHSALKNLAKK